VLYLFFYTKSGVEQISAALPLRISQAVSSHQLRVIIEPSLLLYPFVILTSCSTRHEPSTTLTQRGKLNSIQNFIKHRFHSTTMKSISISCFIISKRDHELVQPWCGERTQNSAVRKCVCLSGVKIRCTKTRARLGCRRSRVSECEVSYNELVH
jgi:hypothetical protein